DRSTALVGRAGFGSDAPISPHTYHLLLVRCLLLTEATLFWLKIHFMQIQSLLAALEQPPRHIHHLDKLDMHDEVTGLAYDSRKVEAGGLFIAVPGTYTDGRHFLG